MRLKSRRSRAELVKGENESSTICSQNSHPEDSKSRAELVIGENESSTICSQNSPSGGFQVRQNRNFFFLYTESRCGAEIEARDACEQSKYSDVLTGSRRESRRNFPGTRAKPSLLKTLHVEGVWIRSSNFVKTKPKILPGKRERERIHKTKMGKLP